MDERMQKRSNTAQKKNSEQLRAAGARKKKQLHTGKKRRFCQRNSSCVESCDYKSHSYIYYKCYIYKCCWAWALQTGITRTILGMCEERVIVWRWIGLANMLYQPERLKNTLQFLFRPWQFNRCLLRFVPCAFCVCVFVCYSAALCTHGQWMRPNASVGFSNCRLFARDRVSLRC